MTECVTERRKRRVRDALCGLALPTLLIMMLIHSEGLRRAVTEGAMLALGVVLPSVFPFAVLADALAAMPRRLGRVGRMLGWIFGMPEGVIGAVILGNILGFPLGARNVAQILGREDSDLASRCAALATSPSAAFVISGVGAGMLGNVRVGAVLYAVLLASTAVTAVIFREKRVFSSFSYDNTEQKFSLSASITSAGNASIAILSSISFFSGVAFLVREVLGEQVALIISPILEVSGATSMLAGAELPPLLRLSLISFALGFSGICAAIQCAPYIAHNGGLRRFLIIKLVEGTVAALISLLAFSLFY